MTTSMPMPHNGPSKKYTAVIIDRNHTDLVLCNKVLTATNMIEVAGETTSFALASSLVDRHKPDYAIIAIGETPDSEAELIEKIQKKHSTIKIIAVSEEEDTDLILRCFRAGADEFLLKPLQPEELIPVFERLQARKPLVPMETTQKKGKIIVFWGTRGGCGTTTLACNAAISMQKTHSTILLDFHFAQGDLSVHLDLHPNLSLLDLADNTNELDETMIESITTSHSSGLKLLVQPLDQQPTPLSNQEIDKILKILLYKYEYILIDIGHDDYFASLLAHYANRYCIIITQDLPAVFMTTRKLQVLQDAGCSSSQMVLVVNRYSKSSSVTLSRISKAIRKSEFTTIRLDEKKVLSATNQGIPLEEVSKYGKAFKDLQKLVENLQKPIQEDEMASEHENLLSEFELDTTAVAKV